jgi:hypothetical protein
VANGFIPVAAGVAPDAPPAPGFDTAQVLVAMTDWDNSNQADCRIDALAGAFPRALLYYELPHGEYFPKPDACSQVKPDQTNGGAWLRSVHQRQSRFVGVVYETDDPSSLRSAKNRAPSGFEPPSKANNGLISIIGLVES